MSLVSIIIPCYNYGWLLAETLDSVLAQTHQHWECFIIDDGSTDLTHNIALGYVARDSRFRFLQQENSGVSAARNLGLAKCKGEFVQFLDGDDLLVSTKLAVQVDFLNNHLEVDIMYGDVRYFAHGHPQVLNRSFDLDDKIWALPMRDYGRSLLSNFIKQNQLVINAPLIRSSVLQRVGVFSADLRWMEDWEFWTRCAIANVYFYYDDSPEIWSLVRVHPTSLSQKKPQMLEATNKVRKRLDKLLQEVGDEQVVLLNKNKLNESLEYNAIQYMQLGRTKIGLQLFWQVAQSTGRYIFYLRSALYWLRNLK